MITKHTIYVLKCDECFKTFSQNDDDGYMTWYYSKREAINDAKIEGWKRGGKYFFCPECLKKIKEERNGGRE